MLLLRHLRNNVVGYLALVVALSGTSYAVTRIDPGSVGTKQLKDSAVTSLKVKNGTLTKADLKVGTIRTEWAAVEGNLGADMPAVPNGGLFAGSQFTAPATGNVLLRFYAGEATVTCSAGQGQFGFYLDGVPIPGASDTATGQPVAVAAVFRVTRGDHVLGRGTHCPDGNATGGSFSMGATLELISVGRKVGLVGMN